MTESHTRRILRTDRTHKNSVRLVLLALADCIDSGNSCPPVAVLADMAQVTQPSARIALAELEADKTITVNRQAGRSEKGGRTNCYTINTPSTPDTAPVDPAEIPTCNENHPVENQIVEIPKGAEIPEGGNSTPDPAEIPTGAEPAEYVRAAGDKESLSLKAKESVLSLEDKNKDRQTDSLQPPDNTKSVLAPVNVADDFKAASPEVQARAVQAFIRVNPDLADIVPKEAQDEYFTKWAYKPVGKELEALGAMVDCYGLELTVAEIKAAALVDSQRRAIRSPACYLKSKLDYQVAEGKLKPGGQPEPEAAMATTTVKADAHGLIWGDDGRLAGYN